jgi:protein-disulfide isomerase
VVVAYGDYECPYCAAELPKLTGVTLVFRHFPVVSKHPRSRRLAAAAEAAALQGKFWEMHDSLYADQGHLDDPHLWERVRELGLDLDRFEVDRRSEEVAARVDRDFRAGIAAGVMKTPTIFTETQAA